LCQEHDTDAVIRMKNIAANDDQRSGDAFGSDDICMLLKHIFGLTIARASVISARMRTAKPVQRARYGSVSEVNDT
jgi:hypothetical protein